MRKYDLEDRLIAFANQCIDVGEALPKTFAGKHIAEQLIRSCTSPALHYGEAQAAESPPDFIHKMKICLKELKETFVCLKLIRKRNWQSDDILNSVCKENNELIAIFHASISTAIRNKLSQSRT